jgi:hypothetical protein
MEAIAVTELHNVADVLEGHDGTRLHGDLICYSRAVVSDEWPAMARGESSAAVQHWVDTTVAHFGAINPQNATQEAAASQWFDQQAQRRDGRRARLAEAQPSVPQPLWIVLGIGATAILPTCACRPTAAKVPSSRRCRPTRTDCPTSGGSTRDSDVAHRALLEASCNDRYRGQRVARSVPLRPSDSRARVHRTGPCTVVAQPSQGVS